MEEVNQLKIKMELIKCKNNPYYFATTYLTVNGKPFTTIYSEKEFNDQMKYLSLDFTEKISAKQSAEPMRNK